MKSSIRNLIEAGNGQFRYPAAQVEELFFASLARGRVGARINKASIRPPRQ
jgi:hypothetical protein